MLNDSDIDLFFEKKAVVMEHAKENTNKKQ